MKLSIKNLSRRSSRENVKVELNGEMSFSVHLIFMALCHIDAHSLQGIFLHLSSRVVTIKEKQSCRTMLTYTFLSLD
jgi:hypothetical protein